MSSSPPRARVAIVEDDAILREDLAQVVTRADGLEIAGVADTLASGRALIGPGVDVLLIDLALPDGNGVELIRETRERVPNIKIIVVSIFGDARSVVRAIEAGADGYLLKGAGEQQAEEAIRSVLGGGAPISPAVASHILTRMRERMSPNGPSPDVPLTEKETAVLIDLAKGFRYKEVARLHGISPHTVADHVKSIYRKLAVNSRSEAVFEAVQAGLIKLKD
ncbi:MAG: response regulator transcription factor [Caulobacteraceae bacterium]|nr:response regulator transcription factor [Caulobacteraceae bacterium]MBK8543378.1 response regulator transcription factor [Caulobacteraceae bacterium]MBP6689100.1 response regulator transcription factor [Hyphomonadaceae bacterium]